MRCRYYSNSYVEIWVMKEYEMKDSWTKLNSLSREVQKISHYHRPYMRLLGNSKNGNKVLLEQDCHYLYLYDLENEMLENVEIPRDFQYNISANFVFEALSNSTVLQKLRIRARRRRREEKTKRKKN